MLLTHVYDALFFSLFVLICFCVFAFILVVFAFRTFAILLRAFCENSLVIFSVQKWITCWLCIVFVCGVTLQMQCNGPFESAHTNKLQTMNYYILDISVLPNFLLFFFVRSFVLFPFRFQLFYFFCWVFGVQAMCARCCVCVCVFAFINCHG